MRGSEQIRGRIFDIQRFSTHDGEGIRTTVFFKGCPLRCSWCQNPEGISGNRHVLWFENACIGCGACLRAQSAGGIQEGPDGKLHVDSRAAEDWDAVMDGCPTNALRWDSEDLNVSQVMERIRRDVPFYRHGGGVTLSGGDPLVQSEFARALAAQCQAEGIHTAMESELFASQEQLDRVLPFLDHIYADLKVLDPQTARTHTGAEPAPIVSNIEYLLRGPMRDHVTIRTPLIPGITATEENVGAIASLISSLYPDVAYELLNYNPLAESKYPLLNRSYAPGSGLKTLTEEQMERFRDTARSCGVRNIVQD